MSNKLLLSDKYKAFIRHNAKFEFLEGTTFAGKTTIGIFKFMLKVAQSPKKLHIISGLDTGTIEKNILNKDLGIINIFGNLVEYNSGGNKDNKLPHLLYRDKVIYILGYDNKKRWKKALGGQYGCLFIDEINIADIDYVREASMRCDYLLATLNPDVPSLPVYKEYINHARPLEVYKNDGPVKLREQLCESVEKEWTWWFFGFRDNLSLTEEKRNQIISSVAPGTKIYKNKILGLRGRATGLVFPNFDRKKHMLTKEQIKKYKFSTFTAGLDTAYSSKSKDTIAMCFMGITDDGKLIYLDEHVHNNADLDTPTAPSDTVNTFISFLKRNSEEWGIARNVFIDSADQATITELNKYKRKHPCIYIFNNSYKQLKIVDRIELQLNWLHTGSYFVAEHCEHHIEELETYSWKEDRDNEPEDGFDHTINAAQYAWIPYKNVIGGNKGNIGS